MLLEVFGVEPVLAAPAPGPALLPVWAWGAALHTATIKALSARTFERFFIAISIFQV